MCRLHRKPKQQLREGACAELRRLSLCTTPSRVPLFLSAANTLLSSRGFRGRWRGLHRIVVREAPTIPSTPFASCSRVTSVSGLTGKLEDLSYACADSGT